MVFLNLNEKQRNKIVILNNYDDSSKLFSHYFNFKTMRNYIILFEILWVPTYITFVFNVTHQRLHHIKLICKTQKIIIYHIIIYYISNEKVFTSTIICDNRYTLVLLKS